MPSYLTPFLPSLPPLVTLGQITNALNQSRPNYYWGGDLVCMTNNDVCCPAYCCNVLR